jgi:hypothetical protein
MPDGPIDVSEGRLQTEDAGFDLIPAPLEAAGGVQVQLRLVDGTAFTINGSTVRVALDERYYSGLAPRSPSNIALQRTVLAPRR